MCVCAVLCSPPSPITCAHRWGRTRVISARYMDTCSVSPGSGSVACMRMRKSCRGDEMLKEKVCAVPSYISGSSPRPAVHRRCSAAYARLTFASVLPQRRRMGEPPRFGRSRPRLGRNRADLGQCQAQTWSKSRPSSGAKFGRNVDVGWLRAKLS